MHSLATMFVSTIAMSHAGKRKRAPAHAQSWAHSAAIAEIATRNIVYSDDNAVPAADTFKSCHEKRRWRLLDAHGHTNPVWEAACYSIAMGRGCPFPGECIPPQARCDPDCTVCRAATWVHEPAVAEIATRNIVYSDDNVVAAADTFINSGEKRRWRLIDAHGHTNPFWEAACHNVSSGRGCTFPGECATPKARCAPDCLVCRAATWAHEPTVAELAKRNIVYSNDNAVAAADTFKGCHEKRRWRLLDAHGHSNPVWEAACCNVSSGRGCPFPGECTPPKALCAPDCPVCRAATWAHEPTVADVTKRNIVYSNDNAVAAADTFRRSGEKRRWRLIDAHGHTNPVWEAVCSNVARGVGCPFPGECPNPRARCAHDCPVCRAATWAHEPTIAEIATRNIVYSNDNAVTAADTFKNSGEKRRWIHTTCGRSFDATCDSVAQGSGCPLCPHKTEDRVRAFVAEWAVGRGLVVLASSSFVWCRNDATDRALPFDVAVGTRDGALVLLVEVDGVHHFRSGNLYGGSHDNDHVAARRKDTYKAFMASRQRVPVPVIRIAQEDVYHDAWDCWRDALASALAAAQTDGAPAFLARSPNTYADHVVDMCKAVAARYASYE